jgi:hypothetical protein
MTPTQRSLEYLREQGYLCAIVEKWNPHARIRQDLWGWCDILAIRKNEVLAVQVTASETVGPVREAGIRIEVHGWRKNSAGKYVMRIEDIS